MFPSNELETIELFRFLEPYTKWRIVFLQERFPDAIIANSHGTELIAEFEHLSANYKLHGHPSDCDLIICFRHNWLDAPLPVWALEDVIMPEHKNVPKLERQLQEAYKDVWNLHCEVEDLEQKVHALQEIVEARESEILKMVLYGWQQLNVYGTDGRPPRKALVPFPIPDWCSPLVREYLIYEKMEIERGRKW